MTTRSDPNGCAQSEATCAFALHALPPLEATEAEAHIAACPDCQRELKALQPVLDSLAHWPIDILRPRPSLQQDLRLRIAKETGRTPARPLGGPWSEPEWETVAPGIDCKLLATDPERHKVSMMVRLAPGARYPAHTHADTEELHLLDGELWIDRRKLLPGDHNCGRTGATDQDVWSETGCICLLITSTKDILR